ncbi:MAG: hypothetical protein KKA84_13565 [Bacteroidetes bacterium]|nr:hypothetical protein [Bacteroidota bacterium]
MIDTIHFNFNTDKPDLIKKQFNKYSIHPVHRDNPIEAHVGGILNYKVTIRENRVFVKGSLPKSAIGNNYTNMTISGIIEAIHNLRKIFGDEVLSAELTRLDLTLVVITDSPVPSYLTQMLHYRWKSRFSYFESVYFKVKKGITITIYDKAAEMKKKKKRKEKITLEGNYLKYEVKIQNSIKKVLKKEQVLLTDLQEPIFYINLLSILEDTFGAIKKIEAPYPVNFYISSIVRLKEFKEFLVRWAVNQIGPAVLLELVEMGRLEKRILKEQVCRMRNYIISAAYVMNPAHEKLIPELKEKFYAATTDYKNQIENYVHCP